LIALLSELKEKLFPIAQNLHTHPIKVKPTNSEISCSYEQAKQWSNVISFTSMALGLFDAFFTDLV
jgi:hypothetical protein